MSATTNGSLIKTHVARTSLSARWAGLTRSVAHTLRIWRARYKERHGLVLLDDRDLRDMRLSRWQVERELSKPFWKG